MKKLVSIIALVLGFALAGPGMSSDAQAKPHGWGKGHGHHYGWKKHGPKRHYGWNRGNHYGWYKHHRRPYAYRYGPRW